jgi:hypothetical protein
MPFGECNVVAESFETADDRAEPPVLLAIRGELVVDTRLEPRDVLIELL